MYELSDPMVRTLLIGGLLSLPLKAVAAWRAARNGQKWWYGFLLIVNTLGILELTYLFYFSKPKDKDTSN